LINQAGFFQASKYQWAYAD